MGSTASKPDPQYSTPLECLLANLRTLRLKGYVCHIGSRWPTTGTFDFDVLRDLDNYCRRTGKWSEAPCVQAFWALRSRPTLCTMCTPCQILLTMAPPIPPSRAKPAPPVSESSAFSVPPEDLVAPPPIPLPRPLPLPLRFLLPPPPLWTLQPPLPPPRLHHRSRILRPLTLSCILLFPPSLPPLPRLAPTLAPTATLREPPFPLPQPRYSLSDK